MRNKYTIAKASISDKIYFNISDIVDVDLQTLKHSAFTYQIDNDFYSTMKVDEETGICSVPSGSWYKLNILELEDTRGTSEVHDWHFKGVLRPDQQRVADKLLNNNKMYSGIVKAECSWGKTFLGNYLIGAYKKNTIIICHTKLLAYQWKESLEKLLVGAKIGLIGDGVQDVQDITVGIYHSVKTRLYLVRDRFELMIVDETHLAPAETFSSVVNSINTRVKIGLSATPTRKDGMHVVLPDYFGPNFIVAESVDKLQPSVQIIKTTVPFKIINPKRDWTKQLSKLALNQNYIDLIAQIANDKIAQGRCPLILSERIEMLQAIQSKIAKSVLLVGETKKEKREDILQNAGTTYSSILSTRIFDEGISCHRLDTLILTCPSNNSAKLEQRIGRIQRYHPDAKDPLIIDFWVSGAIVMAQQNKRLEWYKSKKFEILEN